MATANGAEGDSTAPVTDFGAIDLAEVRAALADYHRRATPARRLLDDSQHPLQHEFTVRLTVHGRASHAGDRPPCAHLGRDPTLRPGFPKRIGTGGEAPLRYADLNGDDVQELILPTEDGEVHAYRPDGTELPGWPVRTQTMDQAPGHRALPASPPLGDRAAAGAAAWPRRRGPRPRRPARGRHRRRASGSTPGRADGSAARLPGDLRPSKCAPDLQIAANDQSHPKCGFIATPAVARLDGPGAAARSSRPGSTATSTPHGHGSPRPGFPVRLVDPETHPADQMLAESINAPAIGDLNGDGRDDIVVATNETYGPILPTSPPSPAGSARR